jgi:hypothetical protein
MGMIGLALVARCVRDPRTYETVVVIAVAAVAVYPGRRRRIHPKQNPARTSARATKMPISAHCSAQ